MTELNPTASVGRPAVLATGLAGSAGLGAVTWQVATDTGFRKFVAKGMRVASAAGDHTVKAGIQAGNRHVTYRAQMDYSVIGDRRDPAAGSTWTAPYRTDATTGRVVSTTTRIGA